MGVVSIAGSLLLFTGIAFAAENAMTGDSMMHKDSMAPSSMMMMHPPAPMILTVTGDGVGKLRGVVTSVNATSLTIAAWGGVWSINTNANTNMLPSGSMLANIKVGDYVGVIGMVSEDGPTISATTVRDWTTKHDAMMKKDSMMTGDHMMNSGGAMTKEDLMKKVEVLNQQIMMEKEKMMNKDKMMGTSSGSMMH